MSMDGTGLNCHEIHSSRGAKSRATMDVLSSSLIILLSIFFNWPISQLSCCLHCDWNFYCSTLFPSLKCGARRFQSLFPGPTHWFRMWFQMRYLLPYPRGAVVLICIPGHFNVLVYTSPRPRLLLPSALTAPEGLWTNQWYKGLNAMWTGNAERSPLEEFDIWDEWFTSAAIFHDNNGKHSQYKEK